MSETNLTTKDSHNSGDLVLLHEISRNEDRRIKLKDGVDFSDCRALVLYYNNYPGRIVMLPTIHLNPEIKQFMFRYNFHENSFVDFNIIDDTTFDYINCRNYSLYKIYGILK